LAADHLDDLARYAKREEPLKALVELIRREREKALEDLVARAEWSSLRGLTRKAQKDRVIQSRTCHSWAFLEVLLAELRSASSRDESEFTANLAILAVQGMESKKYPVSHKNDLLAGVWTEVANVRRIGTEWHHADVALRRAEHFLAEGTGDLLPRARTLSIAASLRADQGHLSEAVALLERCRQIYETSKDWPLVARTLVKMAYVLMESEPERGLGLLDQAEPLMPAEDATLRWLSANLRAGGLIETGQVEQALMVFQQAESLLAAQTRPNAKLRNTFTAARLLEALGRAKEAERLFEEVIAEGLEREWYKDAFLDFLYLFGFHIRAGSSEKAADVCWRALAQLDLLELGHDQLRVVWTQLKEAAERQAMTHHSLAIARAYLRVHWKHPAPKAPDFTAESIR
jgi:tetratricopeptide (TPR) repeat protein